MAIKRREAFKNLKQHLRQIKTIVQEIDQDAEVYLFGSVPENNYNYSSDIDVLIITKSNQDEVRVKLWKADINEPFELHIHSQEKAQRFRGKLYKVE